MRLSDEGEAYYRKELKKKLDDQPSSKYQEIVKKYNHTLFIDDAGNIIEITDISAFDHTGRKSYLVKKNGKFDQAYTEEINEEVRQLEDQNFAANSKEFLNGLGQILLGMGFYLGSTAIGAGGFVLAPITGGASMAGSIAAVSAGYVTAGTFVTSGAAALMDALVKTELANGDISLNASNYESWQQNKPTSKTIGKKVSVRYKNKTYNNVRVDAEVDSGNSGKIQIQSGSGKKGYDINHDTGAEKITNRASVEKWIKKLPELKNISNFEREKLIQNILKAKKYIESMRK